MIKLKVEDRNEDWEEHVPVTNRSLLFGNLQHHRNHQKWMCSLPF